MIQIMTLVNFFVGETFIVKDMKNAGVRQAEGVKFTVESKQVMAQWLKQCMVKQCMDISPSLNNTNKTKVKSKGASYSFNVTGSPKNF